MTLLSKERNEERGNENRKRTKEMKWKLMFLARFNPKLGCWLAQPEIWQAENPVSTRNLSAGWLNPKFD
jgi:hypothetical protein